MELDVVKDKGMGYFSFRNNFEVIVNHSKDAVFKNFISYVQTKNWNYSFSETKEELYFTTNITLVAYPMNFDIFLLSVNESSTKIIINTNSSQLDMGRSQKIIDDILKEENFAKYKTNKKPIKNDIDIVQEDFEVNTNNNSWIKIIFIGVAIILGIIILTISNKSDETHQSNNTNYSINNTNNTDIEPWMAGTWKGNINAYDFYGNPLTFYWTLEISPYGSTTEIVETSRGGYDMETYTLSYDRNSKQLYYRNSGGNITINVDPYSKKLYMPSEFGTMYLYKQ